MASLHPGLTADTHGFNASSWHKKRSDSVTLYFGPYWLSLDRAAAARKDARGED
jgi:hypothetical protein